MASKTILQKAISNFGEILPDIDKYLDDKSFESFIEIIESVPEFIHTPSLLKTDPFATALAHEVRNPLSSINMAAEMLDLSGISDDQKFYVDIIKRNSVRINNLIAELLTTKHTDEMHLEILSVHQLLDEVLALNEDRIILKNILVSKHYAKNVCKVLGNKQQIMIAFSNIIINAIDAMPSNNGELKLLVKPMNGKCVVEIEDNGIGISKENIKKIFKPYFSNKPSGMGLGLSTTLEILLSNHAKIKVKSGEGIGTHFTLSFDSIQSIRELFV